MTNAELSPLVEVVERLLAPGGCPWDRAQTHASMRKHMIEEAYEVCDAIDRKDAENLREELGDVLYQVVFHAALAEEEGAFDLQAVIDGVAKKCAAAIRTFLRRIQTTHRRTGRASSAQKKLPPISRRRCQRCSR